MISMRHLRWGFCQSAVGALLTCLLLAPLTKADPNDFSQEEIDFFESKIRPALIKHCYVCHSSRADEIQGELRLDSQAGWQAGGASGPVIVPGRPEESLFIAAIRHVAGVANMPPKQKLPATVVEDFEAWVRLGAPDPRTASVAHPDNDLGEDVASTHWAFQPPRVTPVPSRPGQTWTATDLDRYVLSRLEGKGVQPAEIADRATLMRRLYFDLVGLPPTFEAIQAFVGNDAPDAYLQLVNTLLESPQFGERWARHWMDVARFADTRGYVFTAERKYTDAFKYRDWLIKAFNDDLPYDRFLKLQMAADRLVEATDAEQLAAMGFLTLGRRFLNNMHDIIDDRIDVVTRGTMALTVSCSRCHDHKYDPIPTADYYALYGVFASSHEPNDAPAPLRLVDAQVVNVGVFVRGNPGNRGAAVPRRFLSLLAGPKATPFRDGSGRLEMAEAIVNPQNPLTARVLVNRVWGHLFGAGLVTTPSDFGVRSDSPAQPEALDYLALQFVQEGWSVKQLIRRIVLSSVYRQRSDEGSPAQQIDPENRLFWRMNRRRKDFEAMRDGILAVAGNLDKTIGGPSVNIVGKDYAPRRTLYGFIDRQNLPGIFRTFDFAGPDTHAPKRYETTVPQQALFLLNSPFAMQQAEVLGNRVKTPDDMITIDNLYRAVLGRLPDAAERQLAGSFLDKARARDAGPTIPQSPWKFGYGGLNAEETSIGEFAELPYWNGEAWQGGEKIPDSKLGWVNLRAAGGHPGAGPTRAAMRRWTAYFEGEIVIQGALVHSEKPGDGVRGRIVSSRHGVLGDWSVHDGRQVTAVTRLRVGVGDTIDFVVDSRASTDCDSHLWKVDISGHFQGERRTWNSQQGFHGPLPPPLQPVVRLAQVLLLSNEFQFVD